MRALYIAGWSFVAVAGTALYRSGRQPQPIVQLEPGPAPAVRPAGSWFASMRAHCNPVEVEVAIANSPPPGDWENQAYAAACYALAGKIERAAERIDALGADDRGRAADVVFNVGHPVADAGDDDAAGPIMQLVIRYTPQNYMALYHAGIAQAHIGASDLARTNLLRFLELYREDDGWTRSARATLADLGVESPGR